jgi:hypothetical protein
MQFPSRHYNPVPRVFNGSSAASYTEYSEADRAFQFRRSSPHLVGGESSISSPEFVFPLYVHCSKTALPEARLLVTRISCTLSAYEKHYIKRR